GGLMVPAFVSKFVEFRRDSKVKARQNRLEFVVVASTLHGSAYLTRDLDICYERTPENMERLVSALRPYHPRQRDAPEGLPFSF
ncbi:MAG TPA: hypothetical protein VH724_20965, partial [Candidatus Angelobacter sp.]|nr:hypothetical protein [Candidatus Angelobacter sp.]